MIREQINTALKKATLGQDRRKTVTLRLINAAIKDRDLAARAAGRDPVNDADILEILAKMTRQRRESLKTYEEGGRLDLAEQEQEEMAIIKSFLPKEVDEEQLRSACAEAIEATGAHGLRDIGRCMQNLRARYAGRMDFGKASRIVKDQLG